MTKQTDPTQSKAKQSKARQGKAKQGKARQGKKNTSHLYYYTITLRPVKTPCRPKKKHSKKKPIYKPFLLFYLTLVKCCTLPYNYLCIYSMLTLVNNYIIIKNST